MDPLREKGKICKAQWGAIAEAYFHKRETLAQIARDFNVTAPAIRYITRQIMAGKESQQTVARAASRARVSPRAANARQHAGKPHRRANPSFRDFHNRATSSVAEFLSALEDAAGAMPNKKLTLIQEACDTLMLAMARLRTEINITIARDKRTDAG
jgi:hypothetical protein